jgi:hypothetical protein
MLFQEFFLPKLEENYNLPKGSIASNSLLREEAFCEWLPYLRLIGTANDVQLNRFISELGNFNGYTNLAFLQDDDLQRLENEDHNTLRTLKSFEPNSKSFLQKLKLVCEDLVLEDDDIHD